MLEKRGYLENHAIAYNCSQKNTGGAGGFQRGVDLAYTAGFNLIWIMDDDAIADSTALETMLQYIDGAHVSAVANAKMRLDGTLDEGHLVYAEKDKQSGNGPARLNFSSFVGLLITRTAVDQIGTPMAEMFLQGDDTEYCRRLCKVGPILFAKDSVIVHKEVSRPIEKTRRFGRGFTVYPTDRFCFQYFLWRNRVWIETHGQGFRLARIGWLIGKLGRVFVRTCLIDRTDLALRLHILTKAICDGLIGRFDNEFPFRMREKLLSGRGSSS
jgi:GT2 family glycosyltransferase